jgi:YHS domain-containing protein
MGILLRFLLLFLLAMLIVRAFWRVVAGVVDGVSQPPGARRSGPPDRGVQMVRDPVCGTFLPPETAITLADRGAVRYFCSEKCRDAYKARA